MSKDKGLKELNSLEEEVRRRVSAETRRIFDEIVGQSRQLNMRLTGILEELINLHLERGHRLAIERLERESHEAFLAQAESVRRLAMGLEREGDLDRETRSEGADAEHPPGLQVINLGRLPVPGTKELAEGMMPDPPVPTRGQALQGRRNAAARFALLEEFGAYSAEQIGAERSRASNPYALASSWRTQGKAFSVVVRGERVYPAFQFDAETLTPLPVVRRVLEAMPGGRMSEWETALWWTAANGWLSGQRPVDLIDADPDAVAGAAGHLSEPSPL